MVNGKVTFLVTSAVDYFVLEKETLTAMCKEFIGWIQEAYLLSERDY